MDETHPNIALLKQLDLRNLGAAEDLFAADFVWHYINPNLPELEGDYIGLGGLHSFFAKLGGKTGGTFQVQPISIYPAGDELVVTHVQDTLVLDDRSLALDAVVVWRVIDGKISEAWDIPAQHAVRQID